MRQGKYPQIAGLLPQALLIVQGRIRQIKSDQIHLHWVSLSFPE